MSKAVSFIGKDECWFEYEHTDSGSTEKLNFDIYIDNNIILFKQHPLFRKNDFAIIDEKHINYKLYCQYSKEFKVAEISNIYLKESKLYIEGFIPYIYFFKYWLGYGLKIEINNTEVIQSILSLKLPSSL